MLVWYCPACDRNYPAGVEVCPDHGVRLHPIREHDDTALNEIGDRLVGQVLHGRYEIRRLLGEGGMGQVYVAYQYSTSREVAVKVVSGDNVADPIFKKRFLREAYMSSQLQSPHTITVFDFGETEDGMLYMAMELLNGASLGDLLLSEGRIDLKRACHMLIQVCRSLIEAHDKGIVHRDLKPDNIFVLQVEGSPDFVKVLDFGIARIVDNENVSRLTRTGMVAGTPYYLAPEIIVGKDPTPQSDLYALGIIFYELLTGEMPYDGATPAQVLMAHCNEPIPRLGSRSMATQTAGADALLHRLLKKDPRERLTSMTEARALFEELAETGVIKGASRFLTEPEAAAPTIDVPTPDEAEILPTEAAPPVDETVGDTQTNGILANLRNRPLVAGVVAVVVAALLFFAYQEISKEAWLSAAVQEMQAHVDQKNYPGALEVGLRHLRAEPGNSTLTEEVRKAAVAELERLSKKGDKTEALTWLKAFVKENPEIPGLRDRIPALAAREAISRFQRMGGGSRAFRDRISEWSDSEYPDDPEVHYVIGVELSVRYTPWSLLGYFQVALTDPRYRGNEQIFKTIKSVWERNLPGTDPARRAHTMAREFFPTESQAWARKQATGIEPLTVLHSRVILPKLLDPRLDVSFVDAMRAMCGKEQTADDLSRLMSPRNAHEKELARALIISLRREGYFFGTLSEARQKRLQAAVDKLEADGKPSP